MTANTAPESIQYETVVLYLTGFDWGSGDEDGNVQFSDSAHSLNMDVDAWKSAGRPGMVRIQMWSAV